jgi:nitroreductase
MAELLSSIGRRYACRKFHGRPVDSHELKLVLEAGRIAPSAFGIEPWRFVVVQSPAARAKVAAACYGQEPVVSAPVLIAIVAEYGVLDPDSAFVEARLTAESDGSPPSQELRGMYRDFHGRTDLKAWSLAQCNFAAVQMMVQAAGMGLATCPVGGYDEEALGALLGLVEGETPALVLALGHCAEPQGERHRRTLDEIVTTI